jgi:hypothetical protein
MRYINSFMVPLRRDRICLIIKTQGVMFGLWSIKTIVVIIWNILKLIVLIFNLNYTYISYL